MRMRWSCRNRKRSVLFDNGSESESFLLLMSCWSVEWVSDDLFSIFCRSDESTNIMECNVLRFVVILSRSTTYVCFSGHFFRFFKIIIFVCLVVVLFDLVHDVEAIFHIPYVRVLLF